MTALITIIPSAMIATAMRIRNIDSTRIKLEEELIITKSEVVVSLFAMISKGAVEQHSTLQTDTTNLLEAQNYFCSLQENCAVYRVFGR